MIIKEKEKKERKLLNEKKECKSYEKVLIFEKGVGDFCLFVLNERNE